jgi:hypothetical protein
MKLAELHDVHLSKKLSVHSWSKPVSDPHKRAPKIQQPRYRRACCGELIQIDGCDHHWFENRAPACRMVYVDGDEPPDAASICKTGIDIHLF